MSGSVEMTRTSEQSDLDQVTDTVSKVFLVTPTNIQSNGIGSLIMRDLIASQPDIRFTIHNEQPFLLGSKTKSGASLMRAFRAASARFPLFHSIRLRCFKWFSLDRRARLIASSADDAQTECLWVAVSSPEMIWISEHLASAGRDLRVTVWDLPEYLSGNLRLDPSLHASMMESFGSLLRKARNVHVNGIPMQEDFIRQYGAHSEIIRHGIDRKSLSFRKREEKDGPIRIVFAGSLYSKEEWNSFIRALDSIEWKLFGRPILLHFMGRFPLTGVQKPSNLVMLGEKPFEEVPEILATMDIGYLPHWFDERHKLVSRTSFPGKLSAYLTAGLAVFHHAPSYAGLTGLIDQYPFGVNCSSLDRTDIVRSLKKLVQLAHTDEFNSARETAIKKELSAEVMALRFRRFLARNPEW